MTLVVQMEPGPIPTLTPSAPASTRALAASPGSHITNHHIQIGKLCFHFFQALNHRPCECPCAVSITIASTPASSRALTLSRMSGVTPTAAATRSLPLSVFAGVGPVLGLGNILVGNQSDQFIVRCPRPGSFSILCVCRISAASARSGLRVVVMMILSGHHLCNGQVHIQLKPQVPVGDNPNEFT